MRFLVLLLFGLVVAACTPVHSEALRQGREAGSTQSFPRPADDVYAASLVALRSMQTTTDWHELSITKQDPAERTIVSERRLDSAVLPGVGMREAIAIFITPRSEAASDVTVVSMASDQFPGSGGTSLQSRRTAQSYVFPAIATALEEQPRGAVERQASSAGSEVSAASDVARSEPEEVARASSPRLAAAPLDRVYEIVRANEAWRPLVREEQEGGREEIRIGEWAKLTGSGTRVILTVRDGAGASANAARLALELKQAGFDVEVRDEPERRKAR